MDELMIKGNESDSKEDAAEKLAVKKNEDERTSKLSVSEQEKVERERRYQKISRKGSKGVVLHLVVYPESLLLSLNVKKVHSLSTDKRPYKILTYARRREMR